MDSTKPKHFISLNKKLLSIVLAVSFLYTVLWTGSNFLREKSRDEKLEAERLQHLEKVLIPGIEISAWNYDLPQVHLQLNSILTSPNVVRVRLIEEYDKKDTLFDQNNNGSSADIKQIDYPINSPAIGGTRSKFATLSIFITTPNFGAEIKKELFVNLAFEALEIFILSCCLLYFFKALVTNYLLAITEFFEKNPYFSKSTPRLRRHSPHFYDEIDNLITNINETVEESIKYQTEIETLKNRAEDANKAKSIFLANINHELRTPLIAILGISELLPETNEDAERKKLMQMQNKAGFHLLKLIDEVLDLSKIEAGEIKIELQAVNLKNIVETCRQMAEFDIKEKGNRISVKISGSFPELIIGDEARLSQIIINLTSNANKFTTNGQIEISVQESGDEYEITVKDTGIGIPADKLEHIFLPFKQVKPEVKTKSRGYGIGLSITKSLVELMNGRVKVESQVGKGSVFKVSLPLLLPTSETAQVPRPESNFDARLKSDGKKVLIAEDVEENQYLIKAFLKNSNVQLTFTANGQEALEKFEHESFALVLMDLQMPVMDGYEATREMRRFEKVAKIAPNTKTPILALTAYTTKNDLELALAAGCDGYITKPFSKTKLLEAMQPFL